LAGVLATLGVQWGMEQYEAKQTAQRFTAFAQEYDQAKDKNAFVQNYDFSKIIVSDSRISFNISSASTDNPCSGDDQDCDRDGEVNCAGLVKNINDLLYRIGVYEAAIEDFQRFDDSVIIDMIRAWQDSINLIRRLLALGMETWMNNCRDLTE